MTLQNLVDDAKKAEKTRDVKVGVLAGTGVHPNAEHGETVAEIAAKNEFGEKHVPARPFLRPAINEHHSDITEVVRKTLVRLLKGEITAAQAESALGMTGQTLIRTQIDKTTTPPNAPRTIAEKGSDHPLIDTGLLKQSINWGPDA